VTVSVLFGRSGNGNFSVAAHCDAYGKENNNFKNQTNNKQHSKHYSYYQQQFLVDVFGWRNCQLKVERLTFASILRATQILVVEAKRRKITKIKVSTTKEKQHIQHN
jgi:hypothetical protein